MAKIPSTASGKITEINFGDDDIIPVGHVILQIEEEGSQSTSEPDAAVPATTSESAQAAATQHVPISNQVKDKVATAPPGNN